MMEENSIKVVKASEHLHEICPDFVTELLPEGSGEWTVLMCTANYKPASGGLLGQGYPHRVCLMFFC